MKEETTFAKARKIGGSIVVTIPANIVELEQIMENDFLEIKIKKKRKIDGFGILKGIGSYNREEDRMKDRG